MRLDTGITAVNRCALVYFKRVGAPNAFGVTCRAFSRAH